MIVTISQPRYLPFLGYFHRIAISDLFVYLDHVQYTPRDWENRNKVKTPHGWTWLTVPVKAKHRARIPDVRVDNSRPWAKTHWKTIQHSYGGAPFFRRYAPAYERLLRDSEWMDLTDLNLAFTDQLCDDFGLTETQFARSSAMGLNSAGSALILDICLRVGATVYLSGPFGRDYLDQDAFSDAGVQIAYQDYRHPTYPQQHGDFLPYMAALDLLFNCGPDSLKIIVRDQDSISL